MRVNFLEKNTPAEWNVRVLTEADLYTYCDALKVSIVEAQMESPGIYVPSTRQIVLNSDLRGHYRTYVGFHEVGHLWLHAPGIQMFLGYDRLIESEANAIAACALIPKPLLHHYWPNEILGEYGYPPWMLKVRQKLFDRWQI